jgi:hypothetical protein
MLKNGIMVPTFEEFDPKGVNTICDSYAKYASYVASLEDGRKKPSLSNFQGSDIRYTASGAPLVPEHLGNKAGYENSEIKQGMIRHFINAHYGEFLRRFFLSFVKYSQLWHWM